MKDEAPKWLSAVGQAIARYGLALTLAWIGFGKYIKMEARVLIEHSPLMSWVYDVFSANTVARGLGTLEIAAAILIVTRPVSARLSAMPGQFLLKDVVLLGVAVWTLGEALQASALDARREQVAEGPRP